MAILCKKDIKWKSFFEDYIYRESLSFSHFKKFYNCYLGGVFPIENVTNGQVTQVFNDKLLYNEIAAYEDGAVVTVGAHYLIPIIRNGIVVYVGEKEKYGNVVIVEGDNGINIWYGNICNVNVKLYDSVSNGAYLGEVCNNKLYLVFTNGNSYLNYEDFLT